MTINLLSYSKNHIDALILLPGNSSKVRLTGFYGAPSVDQRWETWNSLRTFHNQHQFPWFIRGDFNEILHNWEKEGRRDRTQSQMNAFNNVLSDCRLTDLGFSGSPFTWSNNRLAPNTVRCHLDRVCASGDGLQLFPSSKVSHLAFGGSDHYPILLHFRPE